MGPSQFRMLPCLDELLFTADHVHCGHQNRPPTLFRPLTLVSPSSQNPQLYLVVWPAGVYNVYQRRFSRCFELRRSGVSPVPCGKFNEGGPGVNHRGEFSRELYPAELRH